MLYDCFIHVVINIIRIWAVKYLKLICLLLYTQTGDAVVLNIHSMEWD